jgi:hypothetical protein
MTKTFKRSNFYDRSKSYRAQNQKSFRTHFKVTVSQNNEDGLEDMNPPTKGRNGKQIYSLLSQEHYNVNKPQDIFHTPMDILGNKQIMNEVKKKFYHNARQSKIIIEIENISNQEFINTNKTNL